MPNEKEHTSNLLTLAPAPKAVHQLEPEMTAAFWQSSALHLRDLKHGHALCFETTPPDSTHLKKMLNALNALSHSSHMLGAPELGKLAGKLRDVVDLAIHGGIHLDAALGDLINDAILYLPEMIEDLKQQRQHSKQHEILKKRAEKLPRLEVPVEIQEITPSATVERKVDPTPEEDQRAAPQSETARLRTLIANFQNRLDEMELSENARASTHTQIEKQLLKDSRALQETLTELVEESNATNRTFQDATSRIDRADTASKQALKLVRTFLERHEEEASLRTKKIAQIESNTREVTKLRQQVATLQSACDAVIKIKAENMGGSTEVNGFAAVPEFMRPLMPYLPHMVIAALLLSILRFIF